MGECFFWYRPTRVVPDQRPLNGRCCCCCCCYCSTCTTGIECSDFTTSSKMCQVFSEKMGLEAGWNCHICLRTEHSTDASATMPPAADMSHGYASMMMDSLLNINSTQPQNGRRTRVAVLTLDRIRYNTIRDAILMCAQTLT